ncbi:MAG TPA: Holliday junction DNA helicase RuvB C-terminal domain-containing protein, partial [Acidobacteriota bacterium]|nr:Holliday junction DNA helicase RuvB C-terminal domain-containing protein [Acidobacteriota bacterium]
GQRNAKVLIIAHMMSLRAGYDLPEVVGITDEAAQAIAARSLGNPRMTKQIQMHAEAWAASRKDVSGQDKTEVDGGDVELICKYLGIDNLGLTPADRRVIQALKRKKGKPLGKTNLASSARVSVSELEGMIEPKLLTQEIIEITPRGRLLSEYGEMLYADKE